MTCIAIIPARGNSRRIPRKNIKMFHGKPIIAYSIEAAKMMTDDYKFDVIVVSTDDAEIAKVSEQYGAMVQWREAEYCHDDVGTQRVAKHVLWKMKAHQLDHVAVIYATSPLMSAYDLGEGMRISRAMHFNFAMSVGTNPLSDAGQFYCGHAAAFYRSSELISPYTAMIPISEDRVCDINTPEDFARAEQMYADLQEKK